MKAPSEEQPPWGWPAQPPQGLVVARRPPLAYRVAYTTPHGWQRERGREAAGGFGGGRVAEGYKKRNIVFCAHFIFLLKNKHN